MTMIVEVVAEPNELALVEMQALLHNLRHKEGRKVDARVPPELVEGYIPKAFTFGCAIDTELWQVGVDFFEADLDATLPALTWPRG